MLCSLVLFDTHCVGQAVLRLSEILLSLSAAGITGMCHQAQLKMINFMMCQLNLKAKPESSTGQYYSMQPIVPATRTETDEPLESRNSGLCVLCPQSNGTKVETRTQVSQAQGLTSLPKEGAEMHR